MVHPNAEGWNAVKSKNLRFAHLPQRPKSFAVFVSIEALHKYRRCLTASQPRRTFGNDEASN